MLQKRPAVSRLVGDAHRMVHVCAAPIADAVVVDEAVALGEARLCHQGGEPVRDEGAVHQQDRFPPTTNLVLQADAIELCALHALTTPPSYGCPPWRGRTPLLSHAYYSALGMLRTSPFSARHHPSRCNHDAMYGSPAH